MPSISHSEPSITLEAAEPWIKTPQAAVHLGMSVPTLRRLVKAKKLRPKRTPSGEWRFRRSELNSILA
jgi:excisionase family DNA binding protein